MHTSHVSIKRGGGLAELFLEFLDHLAMAYSGARSMLIALRGDKNHAVTVPSILNLLYCSMYYPYLDKGEQLEAPQPKQKPYYWRKPGPSY